MGLALINTLINQRWDLHLQRLHESVSWGRSAADETLARLTQGFSSLGSDAPLAATAKLAQMVRREALVMALGDVFLALTVLFFALMVTPFMCRPASATVAEAH